MSRRLRAERRYPSPGMMGPRAIAWWSLRTLTAGVRVEGIENVPRAGPVLIVARHYHHRLDAAVLVHYLPRPAHIVVALDWAADARERRRMERACAWARWPVILRPATTGTRRGYAASEVPRYLRSGLRDAADLLRARRVVIVFPEGYPAIDRPGTGGPPHERDADGFLAFAAGFRTIAGIARRGGADAVAVVPAGFSYELRGRKWNVVTRFGTPLAADTPVESVERAVRALSR